MTERSDLPRLKQMYVEGDVELDVFEAMVDWYLDEKDGKGPTIFGTPIPRSVDPDPPPTHNPREMDRVKERL